MAICECDSDTYDLEWSSFVGSHGPNVACVEGTAPRVDDERMAHVENQDD